MKEKFSCIVVCYNPDNSVLDNLKSYISYVGKVIVVDNSNVDNSQLFSSLSEDLIYIPLYKNTGIAYALNIGVEKSKELGYEYIITMDQDSSFATNLVDVYSHYISNYPIDQIGALSPVYITDRGFNRTSKEEFEQIKITMQSGSMFFADKFDVIGFFDNDLFLDVVDWEYFFRIYTLGYKTIQCNKAILKHAPAETLTLFKIKGKTIGVGVASPVRYYYQIRNLLWCVLHKKSFFMVKTIAYKFIKILCLFNNKKQYLSFAYMAIKDAFNNRLGAYDTLYLEKSRNEK
ncbi:glycosyltransferase [Actinobacillus genomosp. 2]|uniref:glycosyltransferase n=1 Tax=Actinobacillus genomosp. 2 TaxID=230709 RepID=UPI0024421F1C|nr:glycosyltransferase [Actinobacillus genomosp. 2]WGE31934.1 glycosyltransferase [Actinobacillus genomosp. 2]